MSTALAVAGCIGILIASIALGLIVSLSGMLIVAAVNSWDDAPGGGFFILMDLAVGLLAGVSCGVMCLRSLWRHRGEPDKSQVLTASKGLSALLIGVSLGPALLFLPWTGPHDDSRVVLSAAAAFILAVGAGLLIYRGGKILTSINSATDTLVP
jgi:hypothetical protein